MRRKNTNNLCQHCNLNKIGRPRGLCWICYYIPDVRLRYRIKSNGGKRGIPDRCGQQLLPDDPTEETPGTEGKIMVLQERMLAGRSLWHPLDAKLNLS
jgi:hypothetical protein